MKEKDRYVRTRVHLILARVSVSSVQRRLQTRIPDFPAALAFDLGHRNRDRQPGRSAVGIVGIRLYEIRLRRTVQAPRLDTRVSSPDANKTRGPHLFSCNACFQPARTGAGNEDEHSRV